MVEAEPYKQPRIAYAVIPLTTFFSENTVERYTPAVCRNYCRERKLSAGTRRRELGVLRLGSIMPIGTGASLAPSL